MKPSLLLVDDNPVNLMLLEAMLEPLGAELVCARSGVEALRQVQVRQFALILLDVQMPEMDGFEVADLIRSRAATHATPIVFVTALGPAELRERGATEDVLFKPLDAAILLAKVGEFLERWQAQQGVQWGQSDRASDAP